MFLILTGVGVLGAEAILSGGILAREVLGEYDNLGTLFNAKLIIFYACNSFDLFPVTSEKRRHVTGALETIARRSAVECKPGYRHENRAVAVFHWKPNPVGVSSICLRRIARIQRHGVSPRYRTDTTPLQLPCRPTFSGEIADDRGSIKKSSQ
jgi:hypothetical protein